MGFTNIGIIAVVACCSIFATGYSARFPKPALRQQSLKHPQSVALVPKPTINILNIRSFRVPNVQIQGKPVQLNAANVQSKHFRSNKIKHDSRKKNNRIKRTLMGMMSGGCSMGLPIPAIMMGGCGGGGGGGGGGGCPMMGGCGGGGGGGMSMINKLMQMASGAKMMMSGMMMKGGD